MSVDMSRALARAGHTVVRFDLSGIGDSDPRPDSLSPLDAALADIREALDSLESSRGTRRFVLAGLCSGANYAAVYAGSDPRVEGALLLEPSLPPSLLHHVHHYGRRLFRLHSWLGVASGRNPIGRAIRRRLGGSANGAEAEAGAPARRPSLTDPDVRAFLEQVYRRLIERDLPLCVVLTGESWYYRESFFDAFPTLRFGDRVRLEYLPRADHVFTSRESAAAVLRLVVEWAGDLAVTPSGDAALSANPRSGDARLSADPRSGAGFGAEPQDDRGPAGPRSGDAGLSSNPRSGAGFGAEPQDEEALDAR